MPRGAGSAGAGHDDAVVRAAHGFLSEFDVRADVVTGDAFDYLAARASLDALVTTNWHHGVRGGFERLASLAARGGLLYDIDFTGGTLIQVRFERAPTIAQIRTTRNLEVRLVLMERYGLDRTCAMPTRAFWPPES